MRLFCVVYFYPQVGDYPERNTRGFIYCGAFISCEMMLGLLICVIVLVRVFPLVGSPLEEYTIESYTQGQYVDARKVNVYCFRLD